MRILLALVLAAACSSSSTTSPPASHPPAPAPAAPAPTHAAAASPPPADAAGPGIGQPCGAGGTCAAGLECVRYYGVAGPRGPQFTSCEIRCSSTRRCPSGLACTRVADGPGQVCRASRR